MSTEPRVCLTCGKSFTSKKKSKAYCTHNCYAKRHGTVTKTCEACTKQFTVAYRFRAQKACNMECAKAVIAKTLTTAGSRECVQCGKTFTRNQYELQNGAKYCSQLCVSAAHRRELICPVCNKTFSVYASVADKRQCCSHACAHLGERNGAFGKPGTMIGHIAWNNGLSAKTDPRLRAAGEKISDIISDKIINGEWTHPTGFHSGWHDSPKAGRQFHRSSYEKRYFELLDADPDVMTYQAEPFKLSYVWEGEVKNYVPDVMVERNKGVKQLVEVKPSALLEDPKNVVKEKAGRVWCDANDVDYLLITEEEL